MADLVNAALVGKFQDAFAAVDTNHDGFIACSQLKQVLRSIGENPTDADIQDMINEVDFDGTGVIEFPAFLKMMAKQVSDLEAEDEIREAFQFFDRNGNGQITRHEFKSVIMNLGEKITEEECNLLVREADLDGDGQVDYEEFYFLMVTSQHKKK